jgi:HEAT repeat protein
VDDMTCTNERQSDRVQWEIDLLGDIDPETRLRSAMELGRLQAVEAAPALVERLGLEREFPIRETLTWAVLRIADDAMPYLREALSSTRWLARMQAVHVLGTTGRYEDADRLAPLVGDDVDAVAARAYWAAGQTHNPSVVSALVGQLSRGDSEHRNSLAVALAGLGEAVVPAFVDALRSGPSADVRLHAADTLSLMGSPSADRAALPLAEALDDPDGRVRLAALNAIGQGCGQGQRGRGAPDEAEDRGRMLADVRGPGTQGNREGTDSQVVEAGDRVAEAVAAGTGAEAETADECAERLGAADAAEREGRGRGDLWGRVAEQRHQGRDRPRVGELGTRSPSSP